jgi:uncharacterized paraquat-inducible protein A
MISLKCPGCTARIRAPRQLLGSKRPCPRCKRQLVIEVALPSDADVHIVVDDRAVYRK